MLFLLFYDVFFSFVVYDEQLRALLYISIVLIVFVLLVIMSLYVAIAMPVIPCDTLM